MNITHHTIPSGRLNIGATTKFKTIRIQVAFHAAITEDTVTPRAVLPYLMRSITTKYPTRIAFQTKLEEMYAASFLGSVRKIGLVQEIAFDLHIIHPSYATETSDLLTEGFSFLQDVLFAPKFDEQIFHEEVRLVEEYFLGAYGDKMRYSLKRLQQELYQGQPYRLDAMGIESRLPSLTLADCINAYDAMMSSDAININVVGDVDPQTILSLVETYLGFASRPINRVVIDPTFDYVDAPNTILETQDVIQGKLAIGYHFPVHYLEDDYYSAVVLNALLGGGPDSLLFQRIREELNKVYFIGSLYDQYKGTLIIYAGIDPDEHAEVAAEIATILKRITRNDITEQSLTIAKKALIQNLIESLDSIGAITARINHLAMFNKSFDQHQLIAKVEATTTTDLARLAATITPQVTFLLRGDINA